MPSKKKSFNKKKKGGGSSTTKSTTTTSSGGSKVTTRTKLSDYKFNVGEARNASEFNQIYSYLLNYVKQSKDWELDVYHALRDGKHPDLEKERPKLVTTKVFN